MFLQVCELRAGYGPIEVLRGVELEVGQGRATALLGRNGAGKSTLMMTLSGLLPATGGTVRLGGSRIDGWRADRVARAGVALVPQSRRLWPRLSVQEHLRLVQRRTIANGPWSPARLYELFPVLADRQTQSAGSLSGGEQQMLALARALLANPVLVLLDEPSEGLAPVMVDQVRHAITAMLAEGTTVLLAEQDLHLAFAVADTVAVLAKGSIVHHVGTDAFRRDRETAHRLLGVAA